MRALLVWNGVVLAIFTLMALFYDGLLFAFQIFMTILAFSLLGWSIFAAAHFILKYW